MDKIDEKILLALLKNSRISTVKIAKLARTSREVISYRLERMIREGIIQKFITQIDLRKLGFLCATVFINVKGVREKEFKKYLHESNHMYWISEHTGIWNYGLGIVGRNHEEIQQNFSKLYNTFKTDIVDHRFSFLNKSQFYWEKIIVNNSGSIKNKYVGVDIDIVDRKILKRLSLNSRVEYAELACELNMSGPAIKNRIKRLEHSGVIERYSLFLDLSKIGKLQYSVFITNRNISIKQKLLNYLKLHPKVVFTVEYLGDEFYEFGVVVKNPYELRPILQEIEEAFPDNRIKEYSLVQEDLVSIGPPSCIFD